MKAKKLFTILSLASVLFSSGCFSNKVQPAQDIKIKVTPVMLERGKYLATNVTACIDCHSPHHDDIFGRPILDGKFGQGGERFSKDMGLPGDIYSRNITPAGIGTWTDGEVLRAVTEGLSKDGHALFPIMQYKNFGQMSKEDVYSIIAYIRTLKPITNDVPERKLDFPVSFIVNSMPEPSHFQTKPDQKNTAEYGKYLVTAASCFFCHTQSNHGTPLEGKDFSGGQPFKFPGRGTVNSANITPDKSTGIGNWTKEQFITKFKSYKPDITIKEKDFQTVMPWVVYSGMTEADLGAIYDYLRTVKPLENKVEKWASDS